MRNEGASTLRVAVLSSASGGGAGIAARRVTEALNSREDIIADFIDIDSVGGRLPSDVALPSNLSNRRLTDTHYTVEYAGFVRGWMVELLDSYDVINVHWSSYLIGLAELDELSRRGKPMLFTLHDYYYITGGCHYPAGCTRNDTGCLACPQVNVDACDARAIPQNLKIKQKIFSRNNVHLAAPSAFLVNEAIKSGIVPPERAHVLRNAYVPVRKFDPSRKTGTKRIVLIADSLSEQRKGMPLAIDALAEANRRLMASQDASFAVDIIGQSNPQLEERLSKAGIKHVLHGKITDHERLVDIFEASDYLLTCSYEDNWPNILVEAGSYGCIPIVGPGHGCEEFVREFSKGLVSKGYAVANFSDSIVKVRSERQDQHAFVQQVITAHSPANIATSYLSVLEILCSGFEAAEVSVGRRV